MKKLMVMLGAVAMSFGLFAVPTEVGISFETDETGVGGGVFTPYEAETGDAGWSWNGEAIPLQLWATKSESYTYGSGDYARRDANFDTNDSNLQYLNLSTGTEVLERSANDGDKVVDQLVKFTGFDEPQTNLTADAKIAVWMSEFEIDEVTTETNLYVTVGKRANESVEPIALQIAGNNWKLDTWYRLTIKNLGNVINDPSVAAQAGFVIYINGQQISSSDDAAKDLADVDLTADASGYMENGQLFTSVALNDVALNAVGYKGIGGIDDIIIDQDGPAFAQMVTATVAAIDNAIITVTSGGKAIATSEVGDGLSFSVAPNTAITITYAPDEGYMFPKGATTSFDKTVTASNKDFDNTEDLEAKEIVAQVVIDGGNEEPFASLSDAFAAVRTAEADEFESIDVEIFKAGTVTFNEESITFCDDSSVTITPEGWDLVGDKLTLKADIAAGKCVSFEGDTLTYSGTVAGTLTIIENGTLAIAEDGVIKLTGDGKIITETEELDITTDDVGKKVDYVEGAYVLVDDLATINVTVVNDPEVATVSGLNEKYTENDVATFTVILKEGYENLNVEGANPTENSNEYTFTAGKTDVTITITATIKKVKAIWVVDEVAHTNEVDYGSTPEEPTAPVKVGYTFKGWQPTPGGAITADTTYEAQFTVNNYYVQFYTNNVEFTQVQYDYGAASIDLPKVDGKDVEWFTANGGTDKFEFSGTIADNTQKAYATIAAPAPVIDPVKPGDDITIPDGVNPEEFAATIEAQKDTLLIPPTGANVTADYKTYFTAQVVGNKVQFVLNQTGTEAIQANANGEIVKIKPNEIAAASGDSSLTIEAPIPGFYYAVKQGNGIGTMKVVEDGLLATGSELKLKFKQYTGAGFYQIVVSEKPIEGVSEVE